jgi:tetratricopeptide (TPR) repeat protein
MKKQVILGLIALLFVSFCSQMDAQILLHIKNGCHFDGDEKPKDVYAYDASKEAVQIVSQITSAIGLEQNFTIKAADVANALANTEGGQRYILYNTTFLENFKRDAQTKWAAYCVLAHEIGHHLNNHDFSETDAKKRKVLELAADRFAGNVLQKMGATLAEAQAGVNTFSLDASVTHPPKSARLEAIAVGWKQSEEKDAEKETEKGTPQYKREKVSENKEKAAKKWFDKGFDEVDRVKEIEYYTKAIELNPNMVDAFIYRGLSNMHQDHPDEAIEDYTEAIRLEPKNIVAWIGRGHVKKKWYQYEEAILDYEEAIKIAPNEGVHYGAKGVCIYEICEKKFNNNNALSEASKTKLKEAIVLLDKELATPYNESLKGFYLDCTTYKKAALELLKK